MQVVYGVDSKYLFPALISAFSVWKNAIQPIDITIFGEGLDEQSQDAIQCVSSVCGETIAYKTLETSIFDKYIHGRSSGTTYPAVGLLPLALPKLVSGRCMFIDADTLVLGDVWEVLSMDLNGLHIGACTDMGMLGIMHDYVLAVRVSDIFHPTRSRTRRQARLTWIMSLGFFPDEKYFNAGVLVMDCDGISSSAPNAAGNLADMDHLRPFFDHFRDQDRLNQFFAGRWFQLPISWNVMPFGQTGWKKCAPNFVTKELLSQINEALHRPKLLHFTEQKPWNRTKLKFRFNSRLNEAINVYNEYCLEFESLTGLQVPFRV